MPEFEIPRYGSSGQDLHGWLMSAISEGEAWLQAQRPVSGWKEAVEVLGPDMSATLADQSNVRFPKTKRVVKEMIASLADFRHEGEIDVRWNNELYDQAKILTDLDRNWYEDTKAGGKHRKALQYALGMGTGYLYETWDPGYHGPGLGDIRLRAVAPGDVTFVELPADHDIQAARAVIIREELPLHRAKQIYGRVNRGFADRLTADRGTASWIRKGLQKVQQFVSPALRVGGRSQPEQGVSAPTVDIFHIYVQDGSINETPVPVEMGAPQTNWRYTVPALGSPIELAQINPETQRPFTRPAEPADCRLFPLRRLIVCSRTGVCYDGSSPWWHGQVPLARIRFGDWPWEALGESVVPDLKNLEDGMVAIMRYIEDSAAARLDPAALYDDNLASRGFAEAFNPRRAGARAAAQLNMGKVIEFPVPPEHTNVPNFIPDYVDRLGAYMDYISGSVDLVAISKAKQVPGADTLEKLLEMAGPIVRDMVRAVEEPLVELGEWRKSYYFQFYTLPRVIQIAGDDGTPKKWQFRPEMLASYRAAADKRFEAGVQAIRDFKYTVTESGINEIHRMTTRLFYLQLMAKGFPISWWTMAKVAKIPNFGPPPEGTNNEVERWIAQQRIMGELQMDMAGAAMAGAPGGGAAGPGGPPKPGQSGPGRPNANTAPPKIEQKDGGTRSTITTSE